MNKKEFKGFLRDYLGKAEEHFDIEYGDCSVEFGHSDLFEDKNYADLAKKVFDDERLALDVICYNPERIAEPGSINPKFQDDKEFIEKAVLTNYKVLDYVDEEFRKEEVIEKLLKKGQYKALAYAPDEMKGNEKLILDLLNALSADFRKTLFSSSSNAEELDNIINDVKFVISTMSPKLLKNKEIMLSACEHTIPDYVDFHFSNNKDFMYQVITNNPDMLDMLSDRLKNDEAFILKLVRNSSCIDITNEIVKQHLKDKDFAIKCYRAKKLFADFAPYADEYSDDKEFLLLAVGRMGTDLKYASDRLKDDKEVVMAAVKNQGSALKFASDHLKNDDEVVLAAIKQYPEALKFASDRFKDDEKVVLAAIKKDRLAFEHISDRLKNNKDFILKAQAVSREPLLGINEAFMDDDYFVYDMIKINADIIECASARLRDDFDMVMEAVKLWKGGIYGMIFLDYVSDRLRDDKDIITEAMKREKHSFEFASDRLKKDKDILALKKALDAR